MKRATLFITALILLGAIVACAAPALLDRDEPVPAARDAERLRATEPPAAAEVRDLRTEELAAERAAAEAMAAGDRARAEYQRRLADELARLRMAAEVREREQRAQVEALAVEADQRALAQRAELDQRIAATERSADARAVQQRRQSDRRWAGWGLALAVATAIALRVIGLPGIIAFGVPAAVAAGCLTLAAWSSVPWLAVVLGMVLAAAVLVVVAFVARHLVSEWLAYSHRLAAADPAGSTFADAQSRARQPGWLRWIIDRMLARRNSSTPAASSVLPATST